MQVGQIAWIATLIGMVSPMAWASYPEKPITIVVPYSAGGASDGQVRLFQDALSKELGQPIIVENKPGASGSIGALQVARSKADGYTLLYPNVGLVTTPLLNAKAGYDPFKDFRPVSLVSSVPMVLVVNKQLPVTNVQAFLDYARQQPQSLMYASAGPGSFGHMSTVRFAHMSKIKADHVPYKGEAGTTMAVRSGEVQMLLTTPSSAMLGQVKEGNIRLLATATAEPSPVVPGVPTLNKTIPGFSAETWFGLVAPKATPDEVVNKLHAAVQKVMADEALKVKFLAAGAVVKSATPEGFGKLMQDDHIVLGSAIKQFDIKAE